MVNNEERDSMISRLQNLSEHEINELCQHVAYANGKRGRARRLRKRWMRAQHQKSLGWSVHS